MKTIEIKVTKKQYEAIKLIIDKKREFHQSIRDGFKVRSKEDIEASRNSAYELLVP